MTNKKSKTKKIIFFLHFHKCAGTFIVYIAKSLGYKCPLYISRKSGDVSCFNGNLRVTHHWIEAILNESFLGSSYCFGPNGLPFLEDLETDFCFSNYSPSQVKSILDFCVTQLGLSFIAFESSMPDFEYLAEISEDASWLTSLRNPLSRTISNYKYDCYSLYGDAFQDWPSITDLHRSSSCFMQSNLYTKQILYRDPVDLLGHIELTALDGLRASELLARSPVSRVIAEGDLLLGGLEKFFNQDLSNLSHSGNYCFAELFPEASHDKINAILSTPEVIACLKELNDADLVFYKSLSDLMADE